MRPEMESSERKRRNRSVQVGRSAGELAGGSPAALEPGDEAEACCY